MAARKITPAGRPAGTNTTKSEPSKVELLASAASLLRVGVSAFGEDSDPWGDTDLDDILEVIKTAKTRIKEWLSQSSMEDGSGAFDALDVLTLAQATIVSGHGPLSEGITISPIRSAMKMAAEALTCAIETNDPDSADCAREAA
jgi:hypothetical protein